MNNAPQVDAPEFSPPRYAELGDLIDGLMQKYSDERDKRVIKIRKARKAHEEDFSFREDEGGIWRFSNISLPLAKAVATSYASKFYFELVGDGTLQVKPQNVEDRNEAEQLEKYWTWELDDEIKISRARALKLDMVSVEGTAITKRRWRTDCSYYPKPVMVLHSPDGEALSDLQGNKIMEHTHPVQAGVKFPHLAFLGLHKPYNFIDVGGEQLEVDERYKWEKYINKERVKHYDNAEVVIIDFEDFICDLLVSDIRQSELVGHSYDIKMWEIDHMLAEQGFEMEQAGVPMPANGVPPGWNADAIERLRNMTDSSLSTPTPSSRTEVSSGRSVQTAASRPNQSMGESGAKTPTQESAKALKNFRFVEVSMKFDVDEDGVMEDIVVIMERSQRLIVWCDYLVKVYADCKLPYTVARLFPVKHRWYGLGAYEFVESAFRFLDTSFNRVNYRNAMGANPTSWIDESAFQEVPEMLEPGTKLRMNTGRRGDASAGWLAMPEMEHVEQWMIDLFINLIQMIYGVSSATAGQVANLPSTSTATGITSIIQEGNKMFMMLISCIVMSEEEEMAGLVRLIQQNVSEKRVFRYNKGLTEVVANIDPERIRELSFDVKIQVSKTGAQQRIQQADMAMKTVQQFMSFPPAYQIRIRPICIQILRAMGMTNAEELLPSVEELGADQQSDGALQQAMQTIAASAQVIQGAGMDPSKKVVADLMGVVELIGQVIAKPPPAEGSPQSETQQASVPGSAPNMPAAAGAPPPQMPPRDMQPAAMGSPVTNGH